MLKFNHDKKPTKDLVKATMNSLFFEKDLSALRRHAAWRIENDGSSGVFPFDNADEGARLSADGYDENARKGKKARRDSGKPLRERGNQKTRHAKKKTP